MKEIKEVRTGLIQISLYLTHLMKYRPRLKQEQVTDSQEGDICCVGLFAVPPPFPSNLVYFGWSRFKISDV